VPTQAAQSKCGVEITRRVFPKGARAMRVDFRPECRSHGVAQAKAKEAARIATTRVGNVGTDPQQFSAILDAANRLRTHQPSVARRRIGRLPKAQGRIQATLAPRLPVATPRTAKARGNQQQADASSPRAMDAQIVRWPSSPVRRREGANLILDPSTFEDGQQPWFTSIMECLPLSHGSFLGMRNSRESAVLNLPSGPSAPSRCLPGSNPHSDWSLRSGSFRPSPRP